MKKKYLFPILWAGVELLVFAFEIPVLVPIVYLFSGPSMVVVTSVFGVSAGPTVTIYLIMFGALVQAFLIGCLWDFVAARVVDRRTLS